MRDHYFSLNRIQRALSVVLLALPVALQAQVSLYSFSESVGTYNEITALDGGVSLGVPTYWPHVNNNRAWVNNPFNDPDGQVTMSGYLNPATGPGYPIGFDFTFNGEVFDVIGISNGGWISFGKSTDGLQAVWVYNWSGTSNGDPFTQWYNGPTPTYKRNRVAGFGNSSLQMVDWTSLAPPGQLSELRMATIGTAPNRVCVIQWKDFGLRNDVTVAMNKVNFQIRLNENDNSVDVVFGPQTWVSSLGRYLPTQIGLSGQTNADFNGRMTVAAEPDFLYDWNNTVPATSNLSSEAACTFTTAQPGQPAGSGIPPVTGLTWSWVAPACPPPTWPQSVSDISFDAAYASWQPAPSGQYEYLVSTENDPTGAVVTTDITSDEGVFLFGLEPLTQYYFFIRSICVGEPGPWSMATPFRTIGGGMVACDGTAIEATYCSQVDDSVSWKYISTDGSPLRMELQDGFHGSISGEIFRIYEGDPLDGNVLYNAPAGANVGGIAVQALSGQITVVLVTGAGACEAQPWYLPYVWRVGCKNCTDPIANFNVVEDCANMQYSVEVNVFNMGSSSTLILNNDLGVPPTTATSTGVTSAGPFPAGQPVVITVQNPDNVMCYAISTALVGTPCAIQDCGPNTYTHCYDDEEWRQWAYQGEGDQEIGIRFIRGTVGSGDHFYIYNGLDVENGFPTEITSGFSTDMANKLFTSGPASTDHAIVMELMADGAVSCVTEDPIFGGAEEWEYVVACYDGCTQPRATFTTVCVDQTHFNVEVNVTEIGNTGSVNITNDRGLPSITAAATGTYTVGPLTSGMPVTIEVEGASVLCSWTGAGLDRSCLDIGIEEGVMNSLALFPNPNDGHYTLELPEGLSGASTLSVLDLAGRTVTQQHLLVSTSQQVDLSGLPQGWYVLLLRNHDRTITGKVSIQP